MDKASSDSFPTLERVAERAGVSISTASRALAGRASISDRTRSKVQQAATELGYRMPAQGRSHKAASRVVGIVVGSLNNPFQTSLIEHMHLAFLEAGYRMTLILDPMSDAGSLQTLRPVIDSCLEGMVFTTATLDSQVVAEFTRRGVPLVLVVRSVTDNQGVDVVEIDNLHAGMEAARHLYDLGHRRIGLAMGHRNTSTGRDRALGAIEWLKQRGVAEADIPLIWGEYTMESGYSSAMSMLGRKQPPTAVIAGNDSIALGVMEAARRSDIAVPDALSIIGFDDMPLAGTQLISLTTIRQPVEAMARTAARRLIDRMSGRIPPAPSHDVLPIHLIQRRSTGPAPA